MTCQEFLKLKQSTFKMQSFSLRASKLADVKNEPVIWANRNGLAIRDHNVETLEETFEKMTENFK